MAPAARMSLRVAIERDPPRIGMITVRQREASMLVMKYKVIEGEPRFIECSGGRLARARRAAEEFINATGAGKVVSIAEDRELGTVTVWYREDDPMPPRPSKPSKYVTPEL